ncbi:hypothetical protein D3C84_728550 [compost metagenome]
MTMAAHHAGADTVTALRAGAGRQAGRHAKAPLLAIGLDHRYFQVRARGNARYVSEGEGPGLHHRAVQQGAVLVHLDPRLAVGDALYAGGVQL